MLYLLLVAVLIYSTLLFALELFDYEEECCRHCISFFTNMLPTIKEEDG